MDATQRIVTGMPLTELWNDHGRVDAVRAGRVGEADIVRLLREAGSSFIVANPGMPLRWVPAHEGFEFWKTDVKRHLVASDAKGFRLEDFPGLYCYVATEWRPVRGAPVI